MRVKKVIYIPDYMLILRAMGDRETRVMRELVDKINVDYTHAFHMKKVFIENGWLRVEKVGMRHELTITDKGMELVEIINSLINNLGITEEELKALRLKQKRSVKIEEKKEVRDSFEGVKLDNEETFKKRESEKDIKGIPFEANKVKDEELISSDDDKDDDKDNVQHPY